MFIKLRMWLNFYRVDTPKRWKFLRKKKKNKSNAESFEQHCWLSVELDTTQAVAWHTTTTVWSNHRIRNKLINSIGTGGKNKKIYQFKIAFYHTLHRNRIILKSMVRRIDCLKKKNKTKPTVNVRGAGTK